MNKLIIISMCYFVIFINNKQIFVQSELIDITIDENAEVANISA